MSSSQQGETSKGVTPDRFSIAPSQPQLISKIPKILPHERVFPVQIGSELFKLSGASISSDGKYQWQRLKATHALLDGRRFRPDISILWNSKGDRACTPQSSHPADVIWPYKKELGVQAHTDHLIAPSYFSQYFQCQIKQAEEKGEDVGSAIRTLYIDRDPVTFKDIALHLQGYHVTPRDGTHFVRLFADAQFYTLPKLMSQLYEESIFMSIGHHEFQIRRDLFTAPGNSPNFFTLGFAIFFSTPEAVFPGLEREGLIRPPSILPPSVPSRSAEIFSEILDLLRGYPVHIRNEEHRQSLLRDCRYFNFKGLEQKLVPHEISYNQARQRSEIVLRLEDILKSGISIVNDPSPTLGGGSELFSGWINYARPFEDDRAYELILEIGSESTKLHLNIMRAEFFGQMKTRLARLFEVIATKLNLPPTTQPLGLLMAAGGASSQPATPGNTPLSEDLVRVLIEPETSVSLDGKPWLSSSENDEMAGPDFPRKRRRTDSTLGQPGEEWIIRRGQWRLRIQASRGGKSAVECVLVGVKIEAYSTEQTRNAQRGFLS